MTAVKAMLRRNVKLFFKDKGMFFTSLITPMILLVLYATFLANVYRDSFLSGMPAGITLAEDILDGLVGGQLVSSILAVSCVTVAFCSNFLMVQDRANGTARDLGMCPVKPAVLSVSYYGATLISTGIICFAAMAACLGYVAVTGWYLSAMDVVSMALDVLVLVLFGTALSSVVNFFLSTQGQISAVGSIVSAGYGFICGAYMPVSSFGSGLQKVVYFLPGTYGTSLLRNHALGGVFSEMESQGIPGEVLASMKDLLDCNVYFFGTAVSVPVMYAIVIGVGAALLGVYVLLNARRKRS